MSTLVPLQRYGDKQRRLRFAVEQKERDWRCCVFADEKTFAHDPRPNRRNDVIWTDDPSTIEPIVRAAHSVSINAFGAFSARGKSLLFFFPENLTAPLYVSILESTVLPAARDWFSSGHWTYLQDLNPIENAWALVAKQASLRQPKTLEELKHAVRGRGRRC